VRSAHLRLGASDDLAEHNLASVQAASERWNVPGDTLRHWARHEAGRAVKSGNVWRLSVPALRRRLARRGEWNFASGVRFSLRRLAFVRLFIAVHGATPAGGKPARTPRAPNVERVGLSASAQVASASETAAGQFRR
jgi:hypothetical protein